MELSTTKKNFTKFLLTLSTCLLISVNISANSPENNNTTSTSELKQTENLKVVRGFVVDEFGEPMVGVMVKALGSDKNAVTDTEGKYTLKATEGDILKFSLIGIQEKEEKITSSRIVNVSLAIK